MVLPTVTIRAPALIITEVVSYTQLTQLALDALARGPELLREALRAGLAGQLVLAGGGRHGGLGRGRGRAQLPLGVQHGVLALLVQGRHAHQVLAEV